MTENKTPKPWEQKTGEPDKPYYFFQQYSNIEEPTTIDKFHKKMKKIGEDDEISYKVPTLKTVYNWSSDYDWNVRRKAYRKYILSKVGEELEELYLTKLVKKFGLNDEIDLLILEEVKTILNDDNFKGNKAYAIEKLMKANSVTVENQRLIAGEPTEIIQSENNNTHQVTGLDNLANTLETSRQKRKKTSKKGI